MHDYSLCWTAKLWSCPQDGRFDVMCKESIDKLKSLKSTKFEWINSLFSVFHVKSSTMYFLNVFGQVVAAFAKLSLSTPLPHAISLSNCHSNINPISSGHLVISPSYFYSLVFQESKEWISFIRNYWHVASLEINQRLIFIF